MTNSKMYNKIMSAILAGAIGISMLASPMLTVRAEENEIASVECDNAGAAESQDMAEQISALSTESEGANINDVAEDIREASSDQSRQNPKDASTAQEGQGTVGEEPKEDAFQDETSDSSSISHGDDNSHGPDSDISSEGITNDAAEDKVEEDASAESTDESAEKESEADNIAEDVADEQDDSEDETDEKVIWTAVSDNITVHATAKADALPDGAELVVFRIYDSSVEDTLRDHGTDYDGYAAFDISFVKDGETVEPDGNVSITFELNNAIPDGTNSVEVKHFDESGDSLDVVTVADTGSASSGDVSVSGISTKAEFEVSSFSTFAIVWKSGDDSKIWPEKTYLNISCKDQHGNLLTDDFVPKTVVLADKISYKVLLNADNKDLEIPAVGSGTAAITYTFTNAEAVIGGETVNATAIEASYLESTGWTYTVTYKDNELEKTIDGLTSDQIALTLYYSNEDTSVSFSLNGGTGTTPDTIKGKGGTKITLPDPTKYGITRDGYTFIGWAEISDLKQDTNYHEVYRTGEEYHLPASGSKTLYAAWTSTSYGNATFYIRLDAKVAPEPSQYGEALYTAGELITGTVKEQRWMIDMDATNHDGVHVQNNVSKNMETLPTARQLKAGINAKRSSIGFTVDVNDDGKLYVSAVSDANNSLGVETGDILYVHWYVQKWANAGGSFWNVDGVLLTEKTIEVTYHGNPNGTDISNLPAGYSINPGTDVTVGVSGAASADDSHSLLYTTKTGYELVGWNTKADGTGETYKVGDVFRPTKDTTLYAMWSKLPRGSVKITKQLTGDIAYGSSNTEYKIRLSISSAWVNGKEAATKYDSVEDGTGTFLSEGVFAGEWTDSEGVKWSSYEFSLKDGQSVVVSGLYDATIFKIDEIDTAGCELSYNGYDETNVANNRIETGVTKNVVVFNKMEVVETGISTNTTPWAAIAITIMFAAVWQFVGKIQKKR